MTNQTLPDWMMREEITEDRFEVKSSFLQRNLSTVISLLSYLKIENRKKYDDSPAIRICELLILLVIIYNSKSIVFLWTVGIFFLAEIAFFDGREIRSIVKKMIRLIIFTAVILLPSYLLHPSVHPAFFLIRTVILLLNLSIFLAKTSWSDFITGLRGLYLPEEIFLYSRESYKEYTLCRQDKECGRWSFKKTYRCNTGTGISDKQGAYEESL